jgi:hypothetical protein
MHGPFDGRNESAADEGHKPVEDSDLVAQRDAEVI